MLELLELIHPEEAAMTPSTMPQAAMIEVYNAVELLRVFDRKSDLAIRAHPYPGRDRSDEIETIDLKEMQAVARLLALNLQEMFDGVAPSLDDRVFTALLGYDNRSDKRWQWPHVDGMLLTAGLARKCLHGASGMCDRWELIAARWAVDHIVTTLHSYGHLSWYDDQLIEMLDELGVEYEEHEYVTS
jgi:hypothetical protein